MPCDHAGFCQADETGVIALDARVRIADPRISPRVALAIRPYPTQWQTTADVPGFGTVDIRPIRPENEPLCAAFFDKVTPEDRRLRLFNPVNHLTHGFLARMTQIDYARGIALVAIARNSGELLGVVRYMGDPDLRHGEFAVIVRSDFKGHGLGWRLMQQLLDYARAEHLEAITGLVLEENTAMLRMCKEMGFTSKTKSGDPGVVHVHLQLSAATP